MSHFPMYLAQKLPGQADSQEQAPQDAAVLSQEAWYTAEQCEYEGHSKDCKPKVLDLRIRCVLYSAACCGKLHPLFLLSDCPGVCPEPCLGK